MARLRIRALIAGALLEALVAAACADVATAGEVAANPTANLAGAFVAAEAASADASAANAAATVAAADAADAAAHAAAALPVTSPTPAPAVSSTPAPAARPYAVQLHLHGSFSEGIASIDSHSAEAQDVGADVIWWSDHDFRILSYRHASTFGFEGFAEPISRNEPWRIKGQVKRQKRLSPEPLPPAAAGGTAEFTSERADEGEKSLRLRVQSASPEFDSYRHEIFADRGLFKRPLVLGVEVDISVFPEQLGPDARVVIEVPLSEHSTHGKLPLVPYRLRYLLVPAASGEPSPKAEATPPAERPGAQVYTVTIALRAGEWNRLVLPVSRDAVKGFPWLRGDDNSLVSILVGVESRKGAPASALFDRLVLRQDVSGPEAYVKQRELIEAVARRYPGLTELQGVEISYSSQHLNEFSVDTRLMDYETMLEPPGRPDTVGGNAGRRAAARDRFAHRAVETVHARGGLVAYNHMFGAGLEDAAPRATRDEVLDRMIENRLYGADLIEVGYRDRGGHPLEDHLGVWDSIAAHGLFPVGIGTNDSHGGADQRWRSGANNFLTWIYASAPTKADLIEGMRSGRTFFGDIVLFRGALDLTTPRGFRMGQIVVTDRPRAEVVVSVDGAAAGDTVRFVAAGKPAGEIAVAGSHFQALQSFELEPEAATPVRVAIDGPDGKPKVLSNPITFIRKPPPEGLPAERAAIDLAGARSLAIERFRLKDARVDDSGNEPTLVIEGHGANGRIALDLAEFGAPSAVELKGLAGRWSRSGKDGLLLEGLTGDGRVTIHAAAKNES